MRIAKRHHDEQRPIDHIRIIERRIEWLERRIKQARAAKQAAHFDVSERDALVWLVREVKNWVDIPNEEDDLKGF